MKKRKKPNCGTQYKIKQANALAKKIYNCSKSLFKVSENMTKVAITFKKDQLQGDKKYLQKVKEEMLMQNVFSLYKKIVNRGEGQDLTIYVEAISNSLSEIFNIKKQYVDGQIMEISRNQVSCFIIVNKNDHDNYYNKDVLKIKVLEPGYVSEKFVISKPRAEIILN